MALPLDDRDLPHDFAVLIEDGLGGAGWLHTRFVLRDELTWCSRCKERLAPVGTL